MNISVLILTKNEESDIRGCIEEVGWCDDIWILDSESQDKTVEIAKNCGAKIHVRGFDGFASQRNYGLHKLPYKHDWLLILDADERVTSELGIVMQGFTENAPDTVAAARIQRRDFFMKRWLRHAQISPYFVRLVRPSRVRYEREVNEVLVVDGDIESIAGYLDHYPFSKGLSHWINKHNVYSSMEAIQLRAAGSKDISIKDAILCSDFNRRRRCQKAIFYRLPCRPVIKLFYMMIVRRSFMDGLPGINYALLQCIYEYFISLKAGELDVDARHM